MFSFCISIIEKTGNLLNIGHNYQMTNPNNIVEKYKEGRIYMYHAECTVGHVGNFKPRHGHLFVLAAIST